jgi:hypothetical protein
MVVIFSFNATKGFAASRTIVRTGVVSSGSALRGGAVVCERRAKTSINRAFKWLGFQEMEA